MNSWITRNLVYRPVYRLRGERVDLFRKEVQAFHCLSAEEVRDKQWQKLLKLLNHVASNNPYYKKLFDEHNIDVSDINSPENFAKLPLLTKEDINLHADKMISDDSLRTSSRKTSGSTGIPMRFVKDRDASAYMDAVMHECYSWHGIEIGDRQARVWGMPLEFKSGLRTRILDILLNRKRLTAFNINEESAVRYFNVCLKFRPVFMYGLVNTMCEFGQALKDAGKDPADLGISVIITTGEIQFPHHREFLEKTFACKVVNEYGCTESGIIAFECGHDRMHLMSHNMYVEFISPETGEPAKPGELGEVVITELHSYTMPFIRYRVGDLARPSAETCSCGMGTPLVDEVVGRVSDLIVTPDGRKVSSAILSYSMPKGVRRFRTYQRTAEEIEILLQGEVDLSNGDFAAIEKKLRSYLGDELRIKMSLADEIPPDKSGKFRHFVSEL